MNDRYARVSTKEKTKTPFKNATSVCSVAHFSFSKSQDAGSSPISKPNAAQASVLPLEVRVNWKLLLDFLGGLLLGARWLPAFSMLLSP